MAISSSWNRFGLAAAIAGAFVPGVAYAQSLVDLNGDALRSELQQRYDAALAATLDPAIVSADDPRYTWASEAKVQCAIAIGFMKSSTRDPVSISKCEDAYRRMQLKPAPPPPPPPPRPAPPPVAAKPEYCDVKPAAIIFFDFDSANPPESAEQTIDTLTSRFKTCDWQSLTVVGHTDRSGSNKYNDALSLRRADAVANLFEANGITHATLSVSARGEEQPRVPTPDGERNPQNRRVEITGE